MPNKQGNERTDDQANKGATKIKQVPKGQHTSMAKRQRCNRNEIDWGRVTNRHNATLAEPLL